MSQAFVRRGVTRRALSGLLLTSSLVLAGTMIARAQDDASSGDRDAKIAAILDRHSDLTEEARKLGSATFGENCAACHDHGVNRAPPTSSLGSISPGAILRVLNDGVMKEQAAALSQKQRTAVAEFLTGRMLTGETVTQPLMCKSDLGWFDRAEPPVFAGWGLDPDNAHSIPANIAGINRANVGKLKLKWALAFPDVLHSRSQPTVAAGAVFVGGDDGTVYALDPETGCAHWTFHASGPVRMAITIDPWKASDAGARPRLYFGDLLGNAYAIDAQSGALAWRKRMDPHASATLTGAPALHDGTLYFPVSSLEEPAAASPAHECCTFRGSVAALDARTGAEKWRTYMVGEPKPLGKNANGVERYGPSGVAVWSTPMVDAKRGQIYVTTGDNYSSPATELSDAIIALDMKSGVIRWAHQALGGDAWNVSCGWVEAGNCPEEDGPDYDFGSPPIMAKDGEGRETLLAGQKSGSLIALDPDTGKERWTKRVGRGGTFGGIHFGFAAMGGRVFIPMSDLNDGGDYDRPARPGVFALDVTTGKELWAAAALDKCDGKPFCQPGYGAAISVTPELVFAGSMDGHMRIFDAATGALLWDYDTDVAFTAVNGAPAHGGSMAGGPAPLAWNGKLIVNSGYGGLGKMPGNVLLMFDTK